MKTDELEQKIEELDDSIHEQSAEELAATARDLSGERMQLRKRRRAIRYRLYRLRTEALGGPSANETPDFTSAYEQQIQFGGWARFSDSWDVAFDDPSRCVHRDKSAAAEWDDLMRSKFPMIEPGGRIVYPDKSVERRVRAEKKRRTRA